MTTLENDHLHNSNLNVSARVGTDPETRMTMNFNSR